MNRRSSIPLAAAALTLTSASPALAAKVDPGARVIPPNVTAGGIPVGGMFVRDAAAKLDAQARPLLERRVLVRSAGRRFTFDPVDDGRIDLDAGRSAARAYHAGAARPAGSTKPVDVDLATRYSFAAVKRFSKRVDRRVSRRPRNSRVRIGIRKMRRTHSRRGRSMSARALWRDIAELMVQPGGERTIVPKLKSIRPKLTARDVGKRYRTVITIDRDAFKLRLFKRFRLARTYRIAVGAAGYDTPSGNYRITSRQVNPAWSAPNKPWAGVYAGTVVPGGRADNPLKARWLGVYNGVGIHGTDATYSLGTRASHGCIRMSVPDVIELYERVPMGTPVRIR